MKIDSTVIVDLLLPSLAFVAEIFELTGDFVVNVGLTLLRGVTSENILAEAGVGEVVGVKK